MAIQSIHSSKKPGYTIHASLQHGTRTARCWLVFPAVIAADGPTALHCEPATQLANKAQLTFRQWAQFGICPKLANRSVIIMNRGVVVVVLGNNRLFSCAGLFV
jgi:hypothetical protein